MEYALLLGMTLIFAFLIWRAMAFAGVLAAVPLGWLTAELLRRTEGMRPVAKIGTLALLVLALVPSVVVNTFAAEDKPPPTPSDSETIPQDMAPVAEACGSNDSIARLASLPKGIVIAHFDIAPLVLMKTDHMLLATGHHRGQAAMRDAIRTYLASEAEARAILERRRVDYIAICPQTFEMANYKANAPQGFAAMLMRGDAPAWLEPVGAPARGGIATWRVLRR